MKNSKSLSEVYKSFFKRYRNSEEAEKHRIIAYIYIIFSFLTVSIFGLFAINPTLSTISNLNKQYEDNKFVDKALDEKLNALSKLDRQYNEMSSFVKEFVYPAIPTSSNIPYLTRQIETILKNNNLTSKKISIGQTSLYPLPKKPNLYTSLFNLQVEGKNEDIVNFISDLVNFDRIVSIERIDLTKKADTNNTQGFITGKIYFDK